MELSLQTPTKMRNKQSNHFEPHESCEINTISNRKINFIFSGNKNTNRSIQMDRPENLVSFEPNRCKLNSWHE